MEKKIKISVKRCKRRGYQLNVKYVNLGGSYKYMYQVTEPSLLTLLIKICLLYIF